MAYRLIKLYWTWEEIAIKRMIIRAGMKAMLFHLMIVLIFSSINLGQSSKINYDTNNIEIFNEYSLMDKSLISFDHSLIKYARTQDLNVSTLTNPLNNDVLRAGGLIRINGTITGNKFKNYRVEYGLGEDPLEWHSTGISLINEGNHPVVNGTIAIWNTSYIKEPGFYTLRVTTNFKSKQKIFSFINNRLFYYFSDKMHGFFKYNVEALLVERSKIDYIKNLYLDPSLKEGWPKHLSSYYRSSDDSYYWPGLVEPVIGNIDSDSDLEILVYSSGNPPILYAFNPDGSSVDGWPVQIEGEDLNCCLGSPSIADIDHDGWNEIFVSGERGIYIFNHDGTLYKLISLQRANDPHVETMVCDLDCDGRFEIIRKYVSEDHHAEEIAVFNSDGIMLDNWPVPFYSFKGPDGNYYSCYSLDHESTLSVGNFDEDPELEIVAAGLRNVFEDVANPRDTYHCEGRVSVYNLDGTILEGFPIDIDGVIFNSPSVGDIDKDGFDEIIIGSCKIGIPNGYPNSGIHVFNRYGKECSGWPRLVGKNVSSSVALADFNNDGFLEIVVSTRDKKTYIFDYQGNSMSGWPQSTVWPEYRSSTVADVDGNGELDVLTTAGNGVYPDWLGKGGVYAWNFDGKLIEGFPKVTEADANAAVTILDIDQDGKVELIASSMWDTDYVTDRFKTRRSVYVWDLEYPFSNGNNPWPMFHHDIRHTGNYGLN